MQSNCRRVSMIISLSLFVAVTINAGFLKKYGGYAEEATAIVQTSDNGYIVAGAHTDLTTFKGGAALLRINANGDSLWLKNYFADTPSAGEGFKGVAIAADGGFVACGHVNTGHLGATKQKVYLVKAAADGTLEWKKSYAVLDGANQASCIKRTADNGFIIGGSTNIFATPPAPLGSFLLKINSNGDSLWAKVVLEKSAGAASVCQTSDGGYVAATLEGPYGSIVATDNAGTVLWSKPSGAQALHGICLADNGDIVVTGTTSISNGQLYMGRFTSAGENVWEKTFVLMGGGPAGNGDVGFQVVPTADGGFVAAGHASYNFTYVPYMIKLSTGGDKVWGLPEGDTTGSLAGRFLGLTNTNGDGVAGCGTLTSGVQIVKIDGQGATPVKHTIGVTALLKSNCIVTKRHLVISIPRYCAGAEIEMYNLSGCIVVHELFAASSQQISIDRRFLSAGTYSYRVTSRGIFIAGGKAVLE